MLLMLLLLLLLLLSSPSTNSVDVAAVENNCDDNKGPVGRNGCLLTWELFVVDVVIVVGTKARE